MITTTQTHTRESLAGIPLIPPAEAKRYWVGLPHDMLLKSLRNVLGANGMGLYPLTIHLSPKGEDMALSGEETANAGRLHFGLLNCNSWQSAARVYLGMRVGNTPVPVDEIVLGKHTIRLVRELDKRMEAAIKILDGKHKEHVQTLLRWGREPCKDQHWQVLHDAVKKKLLPGERFSTVLNHMETHGNTVASMLEGFALATRMGPTLKQLPTILKFHDMLKFKDSLTR